ncbi:MAG: SGNH/GDSL hydrolase family protein [Bacteroidaceae bacterium]|nr:SGNH/GDSL hydrolase family protein [Bacteroidaceae bacterium]
MNSLLHISLLALALLLPTAARAVAVDTAAWRVVVLGDSNTWFSGDDCTGEEGWPRWFAERFRPAALRSYARSGATWTHTPRTRRDLEEYTEIISDNNVVYNQAVRLLTDVAAGCLPAPDIIVIAAGTNDAWFRRRRPKVFAQTAAQAFSAPAPDVSAPAAAVTLAAAVRLDCEMLRAALPEARIVLLTPMQTVAVADTEIRRTGDLIAACAARLDLACIRLDSGTCVVSVRERRRRTYTKDGTHTNRAGAQQVGRYVAEKLLELIANP